MRIGIITHKFNAGQKQKDAGIFVANLTRRLSKKHEVFVIPIGSQSSGNLGEWSPYNLLSFFRYRALIASGIDSAKTYISHQKPDILLALWAIPAGIIAYHLKKLYSIPYAIWCLGSDINYYSRLPILQHEIKRSLKGSYQCFANSRSLCTKVTKLSGKQCRYIPAATDMPNPHGTPLRLGKNYYHFLFVGRLEHIKGADLLPRAVHSLQQQSIPFRLHIVGDGSLRTFLEKERDVHLLGNLDRVEVRRYMDAADCLIVPSRSESVPLVIGEAARSGLPIIATDVGDCGYLIRKYHVGRVVEPGSPSALAHAMHSMMTNSPKKKYARGLRQLAAAFDPDAVIGMLERALRLSKHFDPSNLTQN